MSEVTDRVCFFYEDWVAERGAQSQNYFEPRKPRRRDFLKAVFEA